MNDVGNGNDHPSDLIIPLLRYQKEWLAWALKQEESIARGGILADDMGMGKTVQAIALVLAKREIGKAISDSCLLSPAPYIFPAVKGTLVICRVVSVIEWVNEIDRFTTKGSNTILVYHGANREKNIGRFAEYDIVIITYSTVETEYRKNIMILHSINWNRIILDEVHCVKDIRRDTTRAILTLESSYKWDLSGTPLQNRVGELYSLYIASPIQFQGNHGFGRDAMVLLKHKILKTIMLKRTKKGRDADLGLPPRIVTLCKNCFDVKEEDYYRSLWDEIDHPYLVECSSSALVRSGRTTNVEQLCGLCHGPVEDPIVRSSICDTYQTWQLGPTLAITSYLDQNAAFGNLQVQPTLNPWTVGQTTDRAGGQTTVRRLDHGLWFVSMDQDSFTHPLTRTTVNQYGPSFNARTEQVFFSSSPEIKGFLREIRHQVQILSIQITLRSVPDL
ncbi:hypothetical protein KY284_025650 [Solanum tuberosum]|nr:hypothetical protein KY284_025650 [Solanum tuberosum]